MQTILNPQHVLPAMARLSLLAIHTGDIAMASLHFIRASERGGFLAELAFAAETRCADPLSVTLWDELARPAPAPQPVDTSGTPQFSAISNLRK
jgi:hypothetical protein